MPYRSNKKTLLVIDDEKLLCDTVRDYLENDRLEVLTAHTGAEGLAVCSDKKVDVVLLDQRLPDAEGHALSPRILERNEQAKIIFVTAYPSFDNAVAAVRVGAPGAGKLPCTEGAGAGRGDQSGIMLSANLKTLWK